MVGLEHLDGGATPRARELLELRGDGPGQLDAVRRRGWLQGQPQAERARNRCMDGELD